MRHGAWWAAVLALVCGGAVAAERIVTLAPHLAELVCAVERCAQLVGVAAYTDAPPQAAAQVRIGDAFNVNLEAVVALRPDLVLAWDGGTPQPTVERLRRLGLRTEAIAVRRLDDVAVALERVGVLAGAADAGVAAATRYRQRLQALRRQYAGRARLRVFYQIETDPAYSINRHSPIHEALELCGGDNVFADLPALAAPVSREAVLAARPQVVVHAQQEDPAQIGRYWARLPGLAPADPAHRVVVDANALTRQSPRVLDGVQALCEGLDRVRLSVAR
ncbi:iron complex transport system substrate-binding protein [Fontimonas thermophila]|uniref:Iron complex transport system substrate-binding protein n=1 Tax=Fontimonas thermophila TaxID=1076937 RepID=A0A1I2J9G1_9GAMM|nr:helical backbone metal receptor [Fontimonas thermophila]SFF51415.1 iron complex transport system substrate-binding protein [Fontimonas thermophila]